MTSPSLFATEMERLFGTEEAVEMYFIMENDETNTKIPAKEYDALPEEVRKASDAISYIRGGGSALCCTDYAKLVYDTLPGRVKIFGFENKENPTSRFAEAKYHPGGHDFAIVDDRYIVDPWLRLVRSNKANLVFDLNNAEDLSLATYLYGPRHCWKRNLLAEQIK